MVDGEAAGQSRRQLLVGAGGGVAAGTMLLAGCSGSAPLRVKVRKGAKVSPADVEALNSVLDLEHYAIAAYAAGIPLLGRRAAKAGKQFLGQEIAHALALSDLVKQAKGKPLKPRASYDLGHPGGPDDVLALLHRLESDQLTAYVSMIPTLTGGKVRSAVATIFANDAQHASVLSAELGRPPIPSAFVTGRE